MDDRVRITIEIDSADHAALSEIAQDHQQSFDEVASAALRARIEEEREFDEAVRAGMADIAAGRVSPHEEVVARAALRRERWLASRSA